MRQMKVSEFDYDLPPELIAQRPLDKRDNSRLMVVRLDGSLVEHRLFKDIGEYLQPNDLVVINETRVIPARLFGHRRDTGAKIEVVLLKEVARQTWEALVRPGKKVRPGTELIFGNGELTARAVDLTDFGGRVLEFSCTGDLREIIERLGQMPLPPYITERLVDGERYQTVYARVEGSAAAPTAGLHFTSDLLTALQQRGVRLARILLHVGLGTFRPVTVENLAEHRMHAEYFEITPEAADLINRTREEGGRVVAVGTTTCRTLESAAGEDGRVRAAKGWTDIFIYPGYRFRVIQALVTNFHLPKSTLLMLVSALAGQERILAAYELAVREKYRFFSFGDAMLII